MSTQAVADFLHHALTDSEFLHRFLFSPNTTLSAFSLTLFEQAVLTARTPEDLLGLVVGVEVAGAGCDQTCGYTCAHTCSGGNTMSCGATCNYTCDYTAGIHLPIEKTLDLTSSHQSVLTVT